MAVHLPSRLSHNLLRHLLLIDGHRQLYHELFENEDFCVGGDLSGLVIRLHGNHLIEEVLAFFLEALQIGVLVQAENARNVDSRQLVNKVLHLARIQICSRYCVFEF
jgi:hypothetical protein